MGRLFDAVSSLAGVCHRAGYEAQAALELEAAATQAWHADARAYRFGLRTLPPPRGGRSSGPSHQPLGRLGRAGRWEIAPPLQAVLTDLQRGTPGPVLAARFHRGVARAVTEICRRARGTTGLTTVALTGGVFANCLLEEECAALLRGDGFTVLRHGEVPPNDGGLALGQLMVAATAINHETE